MKIVVITNEELKKEMLFQELSGNIEVEWQQEMRQVHGADAYIDLLFNHSAERIDKLKEFQPAIIIVNSVIVPLNDLPAGFVRINGWNSFLRRPLVEAAGDDVNKIASENIFSCFKKLQNT